MKVIICAGGIAPSQKLLLTELNCNEETIVIAADGGANYLYNYRIIPHYLIGDEDSITPTALDFMLQNKVIRKRYPSNKDFTDGRLAFDLAFTLQPDSITIFGGTLGARLDHLLGIFGLLNLALIRKIPTKLKDDYQTVMLYDRNFTIQQPSGSKFSLQAYSDKVTNLTIKEAKFPLNSYLLTLGSDLTIANETADTPTKITFDNGKILLFLYNHSSTDNNR